MKKIKKNLLISLLIPVLSHVAVSQCDDKSISTNPANPFNAEKSSAENHFFWFPHNGKNNNQISMRLSGQPSVDVLMNNPFWQGPTTNNFDYIAQYGNSDFYPEDGWELIKADFGRLADNNTLRNTLPSMTYLCLYNKYSGIMRFLGAIPNANEAWQIVKFNVILRTHRLGFSSPNSTNRDLAATNLLSINGSNIGTLDEPTNKTNVELISEFPGVNPGGYFFWFDLPVAYDPCICYNDAAIMLSGELIKKSTFSASGSLFGTIQNSTNNSSYSNLVAKRVIGAAVATGIGLVSKGQVIQTSKFLDLIDLITNNPDINTDTKNQYSALKKYLEAVNTLVRKDDKWVDLVTSESLTDDQVKKLLGALGSFMSSNVDLALPGGGGKSITSVTGRLFLSGGLTQSNQIDQKPYWSVPGSKLSNQCSEEVGNVSNSSLKNPEYPIYNEPLGTFAFPKKPKIKLNIQRTWEHSVNQYKWDNPTLPTTKNYWLCDGFSIEGYLPEDLLFTVNPKLNINVNKTKISAMFVVDFERGPTKDWSWELIKPDLIPDVYKNSMNYNAIKDKKPIGFVENIFDNQVFITTPVDINNFREVYIKGKFIVKDYNAQILPYQPKSLSDIDPSYLPRIYIRYIIEFESNNLGKNGKPLRNTQIFTLPAEFESFDPNSFPYLKNIDDVEDLNFNLPGGIFYVSDQIIYGKKIRISTNLRSANGVKIKIIAFEEIIVDPNAEIDDNIELIVQKTQYLGRHPQSFVSADWIKNFCEDKLPNLKYKAKNWAASVPNSMDTDRIIKDLSLSLGTQLNVHPNPSDQTTEIHCLASEEGDYLLSVVDLSGRQIISKPVKILNGKNVITLNTLNLSNGMYFVSLSNQTRRTTQKLLVNHND